MKKLFLALFVVLALGMISTSVWAKSWEIGVEAMVAAVPPGDLMPHPYDDVWEDADTAPGLLVRVGMYVYFLIVATNDTDYPLWLDSWVVPDSLLMSGIHIEGLIPIGGIQDPDPLPPGGIYESCYELGYPVTAVYNSGETETNLMGVLGRYEFRDVPEGSYEACSHGFWKNHPERWDEPPQVVIIHPSDLIVAVFTSAVNLVGDDDTAMDALEYEGGEGLDGAARILLRESVAALLNERLDDGYYDYLWDYPYDHPDDIITEVNLALDAGSDETEEEHRKRILDLSEKLEGYNNGVCPLEGDYPPLVPANGHDYVNYTAVYEACSHGFWKNHPEEWEGLDYSPSDLIVAIFTSAVNLVGDDDTLMDALEYGDSKGIDGAARILLRQGVAALLNEALDADDDDPWDYPYGDPDGVIAEVNLALDAVAGETEKEHRRRILDLSEKLEGYNNGLCPLEGDD